MPFLLRLWVLFSAAFFVGADDLDTSGGNVHFIARAAAAEMTKEEELDDSVTVSDAKERLCNRMYILLLLLVPLVRVSEKSTHFGSFPPLSTQKVTAVAAIE